MKKKYSVQHLWARGYFCATVGAVDGKTVREYIESQTWDTKVEGFKVTAPAQPLAGFSRKFDFQYVVVE